MIRVELPAHLRSLARVEGLVEVEVERATVGAVLDEVERRFPVLRGTIRDHGKVKRRPFVRFFACREDMSHCGWDQELPAAVVEGSEPFLIVGAMAGG